MPETGSNNENQTATILEFDSNNENQATTVDVHGFDGIVCQEREIYLKSGGSTLQDRYSGAWADLEELAFRLYEEEPDVRCRGKVFSFSDARLRSVRKGLRGELAVSYVLTASEGEAEGDPDVEDQILWDVESMQIQSAILAKPELSGYAEAVSLWQMSDPEMKRAWKYVDGEGNEYELSGFGLDAAKLLAKGVTGYLQFYPVIRKTTRSKSKPSVVCANLMKVGTPDACPLTVAGSWQWLATADNCSQQSDKTWRRVQMWTGAENWDELLYDRIATAGSGGNGT